MPRTSSPIIILKLRYETIKIADIVETDTLDDLIFFLNKEYLGKWLKGKQFMTDKFREIDPSTKLLTIKSYGKTQYKRLAQKKAGNIVIYARDFIV
tara:strand:+ start:302 stop:589 length:288 start_codon:yes stop_codon:yes gene_type:complete